MQIIVCVDDKGGMLFNSRRQSRDRALISDILSELGDKKIHITSFSQLLFEDFADRYVIEDDGVQGLIGDEVCFVENIDVTPYLDKIDRITVYRWNRRYPGDFFFTVDLEKEGFVKKSCYEFEGYSHEKITREIFEK